MAECARRPRSTRAFRRARRSLVGGVDSPVRSFRAVGGTPVFFSHGKGAYLVDLDGHRYLDLVGSWGANLLGNAPGPVVRAVRATAGRGLTFGAPTELEHGLAERVRASVPSVDRVRFVSSGTEAVMTAIRLARGFTGRSKVVKFAGGYHGHSDGLLVKAGSGAATLGRPDSAGIPAAIAQETIVLPYNDPARLRRTFEDRGEEIAAVVVEPVAANMGLVPPREGFLREIDRVSHRAGALWIADEVITGFRLRKGVAHTLEAPAADLVAFGKVLGGGMPLGAIGGRSEVLDELAPEGPVYQAGTLAGHPCAMAAGAAMLDALGPEVYRRLEARGRSLEALLQQAGDREDAEDLHVARRGSLVGVHFGASYPRDFAEAERGDRGRYAAFFHAALDGGVYLPPSPLETLFLSSAISEADLARAEPVLRRAVRPPASARGA